jgi:hypothetical protein
VIIWHSRTVETTNDTGEPPPFSPPPWGEGGKPVIQSSNNFRSTRDLSTFPPYEESGGFQKDSSDMSQLNAVTPPPQISLFQSSIYSSFQQTAILFPVKYCQTDNSRSYLKNSGSGVRNSLEMNSVLGVCRLPIVGRS